MLFLKLHIAWDPTSQFAAATRSGEWLQSIGGSIPGATATDLVEAVRLVVRLFVDGPFIGWPKQRKPGEKILNSFFIEIDSAQTFCHDRPNGEVGELFKQLRWRFSGAMRQIVE